MKTRKAVTKRFKVTASGKLKYNKPGRRHIMTKKTAKRKRQLRQGEVLAEAQTETYKRMMCV